MSDHQERRRFQRVAFDSPTELRQGDRRWPVELIDLSLKGLLIKCPEPWDPDLTQDFEALVHLGEQVTLWMQVELRHEEGNRLGFVCLRTDIDSSCHLRRLVELNLADNPEMMRELRELIEV
ncbi:PilZ domain-containing protein [Pseudomonas putida]|uniref:PilZ domain-containing protein n=1 Tax=Pseudomonas putida TaxID=303 RepID=UPI0023664A6D|nr:PilZ domain-containing protein [Pseudomonas putida]MDD2050697.1 PilZ domain-containing protein [Pseudomonas putida]